MKDMIIEEDLVIQVARQHFLIDHSRTLKPVSVCILYRYSSKVDEIG